MMAQSDNALLVVVRPTRFWRCPARQKIKVPRPSPTVTGTRIDTFTLRQREGYYRPSDDYISMPAFAAFKSAAAFYATTFHELGPKIDLRQGRLQVQAGQPYQPYTFSSDRESPVMKAGCGKTARPV
jgi:hypothetical protein